MAGPERNMAEGTPVPESEVGVSVQGPTDPTKIEGLVLPQKPSETQVFTNASLADEERIQAAGKLLGSQLTPEQDEAILKAHQVGSGGPDKEGPAGVYNYTFGQLKEKAGILKEAGFTKEERHVLIRSGITGEAEVTALMEKADKEAKERGPDYWMATLQELHDLPAADREARKDEYNDYCQRLHDFAHDKKVFNNSPEVTILEEQLKDFEKQEIETGNRTEEEKEILKALLDDLEKQQNERIRVRNSLDLRAKAPDLFTKKEWDELKDREDKLRTDPDGIDSLEAEIATRTTPNFLSKRDSLKQDIADAKKGVEVRQGDTKQQELNKQRGEPDLWVRKEEDRLLQDEKPVLKEQPEDLPSFSEVLKYFNEQKRLSDEGDPSFWPEGYNRAKEALSWYFHEAREQGVLNDDLENTLNKKYREWAADLMSHREMNPYDGSVRIIQKTFPQVQGEIIGYFDDLLDFGKALYVEHDKHWNFLQRHGVNAETRARLRGVREELVRRAQIQMEDSLWNLDQQLKGQPFSFTPLEDRIFGEWNVHRLEREIRESHELQEAQERSRPLFRHESYYSIDLLGTTREEIERGADQAADYIIGSATTFSLEVVRQRMELLTQGLEKKIGTVEASEKISRKEATDIIHEIQRTATNKLDFFILEWTSDNLLMDQFAGYYSDRFRMDGDQKLKRIPAMNDGLVGLAIHWLTGSQYELYHRPQGFKGQLYDDDQTHKTMRDLMKEQIIQRLINYELKGGDDQEKAQNRSNLTFGPTIHEYLQQFDRKGIIPAGILENFMPGGADSTKFFEGLAMAERVNLLEVMNDLTNDKGENLGQKLFNSLTADQKVDIRQWQYDQALQEAQDKGKAVTFKDLAKVREAAKELAEEKNYYLTIRSRVESAFKTADSVLNIFGEAAFLNAPSIVMENGSVVMNEDFARESSGFTEVAEKRFQNLITKSQAGTFLSNEEKKELESLQQVKADYEKLIKKRGDFISINDYKIVQKYAILEAGKGLMILTGKDGKEYRIDDNLALIRYRGKAWRERWRAAGLDRSKADRKIVVDFTLPDRTKAKVTFELAEGFEETGLTKQEWQAFKDEDKKLREQGYLYQADNGKTFAEIIKMDELQPVLNNFLADYKSSMSEINDPNVIEKAARGRMMSIANIRKRLGFSRRQRLEGTTQQEIDEYTQRIEDSRSFDAELERLAYFAATHDLSQPPMIIERGHPVYKFSADRIDYGYQRSWGVKRLYHLKAFWLTNLRRTVPRAVDLVPLMPFSITSLRRELAFDSFLQMCWDVGKMESIDNPALVMMGNRHQAMGVIRGAGEGSISDRDWKKVWGFWEKPLVDANGLWKFVHFMDQKTTWESVEDAIKNPRMIMALEQREAFINHLQEVTFTRFLPILVATEKSLGEDRQALSAGSGYEENEKFALRFLEWLMSEKYKDEKGGEVGRQQGGMAVQKEIVKIINLITTPKSYREDSSIWDEFWRKQTPSHNPRLPNKAPQLTYTVIV